MTILYVAIRQNRGPIEYDHEDIADPYDNYSRESISIEVEPFAYLKRESCQEFWTEEVEIPFKPVVGKKVYMVLPRYSSGGTFGTTSGYHQIYGIYSTAELANDVERFLHCEYAAYQTSGSFAPGAHRSWMGYFESLEDIEIHELTVHE